MSSPAAIHLANERKNWRKDPIFGFIARPVKNSDNTLNLFEWDCTIPGKKLTPWEGGKYKLKIRFKSNHPECPPYCAFTPPIFHPNVRFDSGYICLSIFNSEWHRTITLKNILFGIQALLDNPGSAPENRTANDMYFTNRMQYDQKIRDQAKLMAES